MAVSGTCARVKRERGELGRRARRRRRHKTYLFVWAGLLISFGSSAYFFYFHLGIL